METTSWRTFFPAGAVRNVLAACILEFFVGTVFCLGTFTLYLDPRSAQAHDLRSTWSSALALISLSSTVAMVVTGLLLATDRNNIHARFTLTETQRTKLIAFVTTLPYTGYSFAARGISADSPIIIKTALAMVGLANGARKLSASFFLSQQSIPLFDTKAP